MNYIYLYKSQYSCYSLLVFVLGLVTATLVNVLFMYCVVSTFSQETEVHIFTAIRSLAEKLTDGLISDYNFHFKILDIKVFILY